ncbi:S9 family peptidase [Hyphobacterium sp. HN65]|uniref:S9 family peptidase n=1 Tax=Hyphobacterium lacteum TaxID=3116575 RepID=A0ABU7LS48_9PROT|nr:S9 family peptidase [Hyphobacterium sp. HN65]MEE2526717.1 S9 family peptidase [Hyphobacterium sp. HN65]
MRSWIIALLVGLASGAASAQPIMPEIGQADIEDFIDTPETTRPRLSPDGRFLAYMVHTDHEIDGDVLIIQDLDAEEGTEALRGGFGRFPIINIAWASNNRVLVTLLIDGQVQFGRYFSMSAPIVRTLSIDRRDITQPVVLFESEGRRVFQNIYNAAGNTLVHSLPDDPEHVLMSAYRGDALHLWRVNVFTGEADVVERGNSRTLHWHTDATGFAVMRIDSISNGRQIRVFTREPGARRWRRTRTYRVNELTDRNADFDWVGISDQPGMIYVFSRQEGADRRGLYLYDIANETYAEVMAEHDRYDIQRGIVSPHGGAFLGYAYQADRMEVEIVDPDLRRHYRGIVGFFGENVSVMPEEFSGDRMVLVVSGPREPGVYYLYDRAERSISPIFSSRPRLPPDVLHDVEILRYQASDGLQLTAYLTRPRRGMGPATPLVLLPHGGPEMRDIYDFDLFAQYYASQGYAVLQPNFRGSSGYGRAFAESGYGAWGDRMQRDLDDAVQSLIDQGRVAPDRICIAGFSYGGYAALVGGAQRPDLYQCVFAGAAVTDLIGFVDHWEDVDEDAHEYWQEAIGNTQTDRDRLFWVSPVNLADRMTMPVLLVHSTDDPIVPFEHSRMMADALEEAGAEYHFQIFSDGGHSFNRTGLLRSILTQSTELFDRTIGPDRFSNEPIFPEELFPDVEIVESVKGAVSVLEEASTD